MSHVFAMLVAVAGCGRAPDGPAPRVIAVPVEARPVAVFLDREVRWAQDAYVKSVHDWGHQLVDDVANELRDHGFTVLTNRHDEHDLALTLRVAAGRTVMDRVNVAMGIADARSGALTCQSSVAAGTPHYAARVLTNELVASPALDHVVKRRAEEREPPSN